MKVVLYMAITANGIIAKQDDSADFLTKEESASYVAIVIGAKSLIIGRRTYEILSTQSEFQEFLKAGVKIIAVSKSDFPLKDPRHALAHSPKEALNLVDTSTVIVAGGGMLNAAFLKDNLVNEIYLDIEPALFGKGIPLFNDDGDFEKKLELIDLKKLSPNEIQLHYAILNQ